MVTFSLKILYYSFFVLSSNFTTSKIAFSPDFPAYPTQIPSNSPRRLPLSIDTHMFIHNLYDFRFRLVEVLNKLFMLVIICI